MQIVIDIDDKVYGLLRYFEKGLGLNNKKDDSDDVKTALMRAVMNGTPLPKGHGRLKDEDAIIKAIEDRVEFLRKNDAVFMRLRKDIDILGCIPKIRCEVPTIIEAEGEE